MKVEVKLDMTKMKVMARAFYIAGYCRDDDGITETQLPVIDAAFEKLWNETVDTLKLNEEQKTTLRDL